MFKGLTCLHDWSSWGPISSLPSGYSYRVCLKCGKTDRKINFLGTPRVKLFWFLVLFKRGLSNTLKGVKSMIRKLRPKRLLVSLLLITLITFGSLAFSGIQPFSGVKDSVVDFFSGLFSKSSTVWIQPSLVDTIEVSGIEGSVFDFAPPLTQPEFLLTFLVWNTGNGSVVFTWLVDYYDSSGRLLSEDQPESFSGKTSYYTLSAGENIQLSSSSGMGYGNKVSSYKITIER